MFNFRIIDTADGNQVIRRDLKTPYSALTERPLSPQQSWGEQSEQQRSLKYQK